MYTGLFSSYRFHPKKNLMPGIELKLKDRILNVLCVGVMINLERVYRCKEFKAWGKDF